MTELIRAMWSENEGQDLVEYALLAALITILSIAGITALGTAVSGVWGAITAAITGA